MRKLAIVLAVLLGLAVVADRAAAYVAEGVVAQKIRDTEHVDEAEVDINGFPFLTQALSRDFDAIEVRIPEVSARTGGGGSVVVSDLEAEFRDVVTSSRFDDATAGSVSGSAAIEYDAFRGLGDVRVAYGGTAPDGEGYLTLTLRGTGLTADVRPSVTDGRTLGFVGPSGSTRTDALPDALATFALEQYALAGLPDGFEIERVEAEPDALRLTVTGTDVPLT